jgi:HlyD family secretion protein
MIAFFRDLGRSLRLPRRLTQNPTRHDKKIQLTGTAGGYDRSATRPDILAPKNEINGLAMSDPTVMHQVEGREVETPTRDADAEAVPPQSSVEPKHTAPSSGRVPTIIVGLVVAAVAGLSLWYLVRGEPLLVQGEVDATRLDIAARVDGRVAEIPVARGQDVAAGAVLVKIDNPETIAKNEQALAAKVVAEAQLANIKAGTRAEVIAARKAALERAQASVILAQKTYERIRQLAEHGNAPQARLDQATDALHESERAVDQARSAHEQAVNGYTKEEREIAVANVLKAVADIKAVQSIVDQMVVYAPVASQVYKRNVEPGEYVSPGVPLVTLIDLGDMWIHFDLREDLIKTLKVGDRFGVRIPALGDRRITVEVKLIATKGEYASWRATRATGDFDLRTFSIRAYPVDKVPELRPGMSAYLDWRARG